MSPEGWQNLALAGVLLFYLVYIGLQIILRTMCGQIGVDYCAFWSAGRAANLYGYAGVYDLQFLGQIQQSILPAAADPARFPVIPVFYLPIFVLPFQVLALLPPGIGYWIWTALHLSVIVVYLQRFPQRPGGQAPGTRLMLLVLASLPVFLNLFGGQLAVWLTVCSAEFMLALWSKRPFRAGLWLGGLLLKPQLLVVIALVLLLQRSARALAGLAAATASILAASVLIGGLAALRQMLDLWLSQAAGAGYTGGWLQAQMNWRMLGYHLSTITAPWLATGFAAVGMLATLIVVLYVWRRPFQLNASSLAIAMLGILGASAILAWHSHINNAMMLIPPLIFLHQAKMLPPKMLGTWVLVPALLFVPVTFAPRILEQMNVLSAESGRFVYFFIGAAEFGVTLYLFLWAARAYRRRLAQ